MKSRIRELLLRQKGYQFTVKEIASQLKLPVTHDTAPNIRKAIRELIEGGCPIGANTCGYFWLENKAMLEDYLENLQSRCDAIQERIVNVTRAYEGVRNRRHLDMSLPQKDRCRHYVIYIAETASIPYQAVWRLAYTKVSRVTKTDLVNLPSWYKGSTLNYCANKGYLEYLFMALEDLEKGIL